MKLVKFASPLVFTLITVFCTTNIVMAETKESGLKKALSGLKKLSEDMGQPMPDNNAGNMPEGQPTETAPPAPTPPPAPTYKKWAKVEVLDKVNNVWKKCIVLDIYKGAYKVECNHEKSIQLDTHVRKSKGQPVAQTAADQVNGPPFKRGDIVLVSPMGLSNDWHLGIVELDQVQKSNSYVVDFGNGSTNVLPNWVRVNEEDEE